MTEDEKFAKLNAAGEKIMLWIGIVSTALALIFVVLTVLAFTRPASGATVEVEHAAVAAKGDV